MQLEVSRILQKLLTTIIMLISWSAEKCQLSIVREETFVSVHIVHSILEQKSRYKLSQRLSLKRFNADAYSLGRVMASILGVNYNQKAL
jgi:hypothetical protein